MMLRSARCLALALAPLLAACGSGSAPATDKGAAAQGEILGGTVSDSMLPLDDLRSESPPMKPSPAAAAADDGTTAGASEAEAGDGASTATDPAPAAPAADTAAEG